MLSSDLANSNVKKKRHTEEQLIIGILREAEVPGAEIRAVVRKHNITEQTFYRCVTNTAAWKSPKRAS